MDNPQRYQSARPEPQATRINWEASQHAVKTVNPNSMNEPMGDEVTSTGNSGPPIDNPVGGQSHPGDEEYDDLSLEELTSLFQNFNSLDKESQTHLIAYMKRLERSNPDKVAEFKRFMHSKRQ